MTPPILFQIILHLAHKKINGLIAEQAASLLLLSMKKHIEGWFLWERYQQ